MDEPVQLRINSLQGRRQHAREGIESFTYKVSFDLIEVEKMG